MDVNLPRPRGPARYGWIPDLPDQRDVCYLAPRALTEQLPNQVDLRPKCPARVYDQGELGSCTANAIGAAFEFDQIRQAITVFTPSRLFIYYNERVIEGTVDWDAGAMIRDGIKTVAKQGACPETSWPYVVSKFAVKPPTRCYVEAAETKVLSYQRVSRTLIQLKACLAQGFPFVFGFQVYESFEDPQIAETGVVPMPADDEVALGGHAVLAVGYDEQTSRFLVRNSWGPDWGDQGHFTMPFDYLTNRGLASDFWTIREVSAAA